MHTAVSANEILGSEAIEMQQFDSEPAELTRRQVLQQRWTGAVGYLRSINDRINRSTFGRVFRLKGSGHVSLQPMQLPKLPMSQQRQTSPSRKFY
jgi:hypothetical protein